VTPLILKRAALSRPSGEWRDDDYDVLESGVVVRPHFQGVGCTCGQAVDVGERPLGGHGQASRAWLRADARGRAGSVCEELAAGSDLVRSPLSCAADLTSSMPFVIDGRGAGAAALGLYNG
jgi:hypothetical protein